MNADQRRLVEAMCAATIEGLKLVRFGEFEMPGRGSDGSDVPIRITEEAANELWAKMLDQAAKHVTSAAKTL